MYLVFLDIDGVLTSDRVHLASDAHYPIWSKFDPIAIDFFNKIYRKYPIKFVLMTTWKVNLPHINGKLDTMIEHWIYSAFTSAGFIGEFNNPIRTNPTDDYSLAKQDRAIQVIDYLDNFGTGVKDYILFDDNAYSFNQMLGKKRLIQTDPVNGLLYKHMLNAKAIMGNWDGRV